MDYSDLEILRRAEERDKHLESLALEASRDGDDEGVWFAMAARAENKRFLDKLRSAILT